MSGAFDFNLHGQPASPAGLLPNPTLLEYLLGAGWLTCVLAGMLI